MFLRGMCFFPLPVFDWMGHDGPASLFKKMKVRRSLCFCGHIRWHLQPPAYLARHFMDREIGGSISAVKRQQWQFGKKKSRQLHLVDDGLSFRDGAFVFIWHSLILRKRGLGHHVPDESCHTCVVRLAMPVAQLAWARRSWKHTCSNLFFRSSLAQRSSRLVESRHMGWDPAKETHL